MWTITLINGNRSAIKEISQKGASVFSSNIGKAEDIVPTD